MPQLYQMGQLKNAPAALAVLQMKHLKAVPVAIKPRPHARMPRAALAEPARAIVDVADRRHRIWTSRASGLRRGSESIGDNGRNTVRGNGVTMRDGHAMSRAVTLHCHVRHADGGNTLAFGNTRSVRNTFLRRSRIDGTVIFAPVSAPPVELFQQLAHAAHRARHRRRDRRR